jgi:hypothetical protein
MTDKNKEQQASRGASDREPVRPALPAVNPPVQTRPNSRVELDPQAARQERVAAQVGDVYEVMVDQWGYDDHQCQRGDLLRAGDVPYDLEWAERVGTVRKAPEYAHRFVESTTQPLTPSGRVDADVQAQARDGAGVEERR